MNANKTLAALLNARILKGKYNNRSWAGRCKPQAYCGYYRERLGAGYTGCIRPGYLFHIAACEPSPSLPYSFQGVRSFCEHGGP